MKYDLCYQENWVNFCQDLQVWHSVITSISETQSPLLCAWSEMVDSCYVRYNYGAI